MASRMRTFPQRWRSSASIAPLSFLLFLTFITSGWLVHAGSATGLQASFFGSSHVSVRLQEARSSSDIYFRLRTRRSDSMLFLAAGRTDYCLLVLDAGRLKVHINLGAGETEIASEAPFLLNDMKWHAVNLTRRGSQLSIQVDSHLTKANLPVRFHELNIHFGIWLGGLAGFNEIFLGNLPSFRGCMSHITYNSEDVLLRAKTQPGQMHGVSWNCSDEFDAASDDPFSLVSLSSYVITRVAISRSGTTIKLNIHPYDNDGLIFYVSGMSSRPDYLALEVRDGKPRFTAELGSGPVLLQSTLNITDNLWHLITLQVSPLILSLTIDNQTWTSETPARGASRHLDVSEMFYIGVEETKRARLRSQGLIDHSFRGCLQNFHIDDKAYGLPEVDVSSNITTACSFQTPRRCSSHHGQENCLAINSTTASQGRHNGTGGMVEGGFGTTFPPSVVAVHRDGIRVLAQTPMGEIEIMTVRPVQVAEGDSMIITPRHLAVTLDLTKFGVRESGVLFRVSKGPTQGRLEVTSRTPGSPTSSGRLLETFSLLDVGAGRVRYSHNGAESSKDSIELVLRLVQTTGFRLPSYLQDERTLTLPIEITAVNDPPEIRLVPGGVLRLAQGTKIRLMPEVITSLDPDTPPTDLQFSLISMGTAAEKKGYLEMSQDPGKPIQLFTQTDLQSGKVWYVDGGLSSSKMALKVTDGSSVSQTAVLRIETFSLRIAPEVNSGLEVANVMGTAVLISPANLSFTSNAADQGLVLEYHVVSAPRAGALQSRRTNGQWTNTEHFTQSDLAAGRLRYLLQRPSDIPFEDEFSFHVSLSQVKVPSEFRFRLRISPLRLQRFGSNLLSFNASLESVLGPETLDYRTLPMSTAIPSVKYTVVHPPSFGYLRGRGGGEISRVLLPATASSLKLSPPPPLYTFTQSDVVTSGIIYRFKWTPYSPITDYFLFNVTTTHSQYSTTSGPFRCNIQYLPSTTQSGRGSPKPPIQYTISSLPVKEGRRQLISTKIIQIQSSNATLLPSLLFNVTEVSDHGQLEREILLPTSTRYTPLETFSYAELEKGTIYYHHDGSETPRDRLQFVAFSSTANVMFTAEIQIMVEGVNNHSPHPAPSASLSINVVQSGLKRVTKGILDYADQDWDSDRKKLKYSTRGSPFGNIYDRSVSLAQPIFQWTQADVDAGKLVFKHEGNKTVGQLLFWVSDSAFTVNGTLEIRAGAPWVRVVNTTRLAAKRGSFERLSEDSIRVETNVNMDLPNILIRILASPQHGVITVNGSVVKNFTLAQVAQKLVIYQMQQAVKSQHDSFRFQAVVKNIVESDITEFEIAIYPEAYWIPLSVGANGSVIVNENSSAIISSSHLSIINPQISLNDILYTLTRPPRHGYLALDPRSNHDSKSEDPPLDYVTMWDQEAINSGRLRYIQSEPNKTHDSMEFDVTNGVQTLKDLRLDFIVVPTHLVLASAPVVVQEGNSIQLNITHLHAAQNYFTDKLSEIRITSSPHFGSLTMISRPKSPLTSFPYKAIQDGKIFYTHDGTETLEDSFTVIGTTVNDEKGSSSSPGSISFGGSRTSAPHIIRIRILPTNDQVPRVVNNTGNWVWAGSSVSITSRELAAVDEDSDGNHLVFYVVGSRGGYPALKERPDVPLHNFTQAMINDSQVVFVHKGEDLKRASFEFELSDGLNEAAKEEFNISVRKPEILVYEGRNPLAVFPFTQAPLRPENLLVRSNDAREVNFQITSQPMLGQLLMEKGESNFSPVQSFTQTDVNNGKIFYQHSKNFYGQRGNDSIGFRVSSKYADSVDNVTIEIDVSVSGAALGGLQRYVAIQPLIVKEGAQVPLTNRHINLTAVTDFISMHHRGNMWRSSETPHLLLILSGGPKHGFLFGGNLTNRINLGNRIFPPQLIKGNVRYIHDDSETTRDSIDFTLWLTTGNSIPSSVSTTLSQPPSTWLLNLTLPVHITPVNDEPFTVATPKTPVPPVVQEHWRALGRKDLYVTDPDTPPAHIVYEVSKISHGRFVLMPLAPVSASPDDITGRIKTTTMSPNAIELDNIQSLPSVLRFSQDDLDTGRVFYVHSGPLAPVMVTLTVSDGQHAAATITYSIPVQPLTLQSSSSESAPIRINQGNNIMTLSLHNLPSATNGHPSRLIYNITRFPLHGKIVVKNRLTAPSSFTHMELLRGDLSYIQTDMSVANDSFEVRATFQHHLQRHAGVYASWLVNVVTVPLLKRVKEVRSFMNNFAVGGIIAPDESEFSASLSQYTTLNLAVLDASPLAAVTGSNPVYEILSPPRFGFLYKVPYSSIGRQQQNSLHFHGRVANRFSHEDIRRGSIIYSPPSSTSLDLNSNEIIPFRYPTSSISSPSSSSSSSDEFIFKILAPGVQPAIALAKFNIRDENRFYHDKTNNLISDASPDSTGKRFGGSGLRDITALVTPHVTKDSLITVAIIVGGIVTLSLFLIVGIRCSCAKSGRPNEPGTRRVNPNLNNGCSSADPKCISNGMIDAYAPANLDHCHSDSDGGAALRPLMMSTLSPRSSRHNCHSHHPQLPHPHRLGSESGSWTSCSVSNAGLPAPSIPQCRVTPLCGPPGGGGSSGGGNSSDSGGGYSGTNSLMMCPLLPPTPICDTFDPLPEEIDPPEPYGFSYSVSNTLLPPPLDIREVETPFMEPHMDDVVAYNHSTIYSSSHHGSNMGTLRGNTIERRKQQQQGPPGGGQLKNQYWV